jgi:hypothetical protein
MGSHKTNGHWFDSYTAEKGVKQDVPIEGAGLAFVRQRFRFFD